MLTEYTLEDNNYPEDAEEFRTAWSADHPKYMAEDAAEEHYNNHDGHEDDWPMAFTIFIDGKESGTYEVNVEYLPAFMATEEYR